MKKLLIAAILSFIANLGYSQYVHDLFPCRDSSGARVEGCFAWSDSSGQYIQVTDTSFCLTDTLIVQYRAVNGAWGYDQGEIVMRDTLLGQCDKGVLPIEAEVSTNTTLSGFNVLLPVNCTSGVIEIDLPAGTPNAGDQFKIADSRAQANANNITIDFINSGDNHYGSSQNYIINTSGEVVTFTYINATIGWIAQD